MCVCVCVCVCEQLHRQPSQRVRYFDLQYNRENLNVCVRFLSD